MQSWGVRFTWFALTVSSPSRSRVFPFSVLLETTARKEKKMDYHNVNSTFTWPNTIMSTTLAGSAFLSSNRVTASSHIDQHHTIAFFCMASNWHVLFSHVYSCVHLRIMMLIWSGRLKPQQIAWQKRWLLIGGRSTQLWGKQKESSASQAGSLESSTKWFQNGYVAWNG